MSMKGNIPNLLTLLMEDINFIIPKGDSGNKKSGHFETRSGHWTLLDFYYHFNGCYCCFGYCLIMRKFIKKTLKINP